MTAALPKLDDRPSLLVSGDTLPETSNEPVLMRPDADVDADADADVDADAKSMACSYDTSRDEWAERTDWSPSKMGGELRAPAASSTAATDGADANASVSGGL